MERDFIYDSLVEISGLEYIKPNNNKFVPIKKKKEKKGIAGYIDQTPWPKIKAQPANKTLITYPGFIESLRFSDNKDYLILSPYNAIKMNLELVLMDDDYIQKITYQETQKPQRYVTLPIRDKFCFMCDYKAKYYNGHKEHIKELGIHDGIKAHPIYPSNDFLKLNIGNGDFKKSNSVLNVYISMIENVITCWSVELKHHEKSFIIPADEEIIKEICDLRDNPTSPKTGRRRPLLHVVSRHIRKLKLGSYTHISKYLRGIYEFDIDDFQIQVSPPIKEIIDTNNYEKFSKSFQIYVWERIARQDAEPINARAISS